MNHIKILQHAQDLSVSVGNSYSAIQLMHNLLNHFRQAGKYTAHISSHQVEFRRKEKLNDQKYLSISSLQID